MYCFVTEAWSGNASNNCRMVHKQAGRHPQTTISNAPVTAVHLVVNVMVKRCSAHGSHWTSVAQLRGLEHSKAEQYH